jgi:hypothetical protein
VLINVINTPKFGTFCENPFSSSSAVTCRHTHAHLQHFIVTAQEGKNIRRKKGRPGCGDEDIELQKLNYACVTSNTFLH